MRLRFSILILCVAAASCQQKPPDRPADAPPIKTEPAAVPEIPKPVVQERPSASPRVDSDMTPDFANAFKDSKECRGIQRSAKDEKARAEFKIYTSFATADTPEMEEQWQWTVFDTRHDPTGDLRGAGRGDSAAEAMKDMCTVVWDTFNTWQKANK